ncbi:hypothetical protein [Serinicoccus chungangensis]|uniref:hypothetical protein n=1 Tax=Serinicoccus chungangensis TaxID=767452 RepID=UPI00111A4F37|nr:hypothetical protein [Serinicoccus chungangensis]
MTGVLSVDTYLAPMDWPVTPGVVVRMWTEHRWYVQDPAQGGTWVFESPHARYEGVTRVGLNRDEWPVPGETRREARTGVLLEVDVEPAG